MAKQSLRLAKQLALSNLTSWHDFDFRQAICSEISLLEGEILLRVENKPIQALEWFLKALKGATYLRLNRRMCDALVSISKCSKQLADRSIKNDLQPIYATFEDDLFKPDNRCTEIVFNLIKTLWEREDNPRWSSVSEDFSNAAAQIWQDWFEISKSPSTFLEHPIAEKIKNGTLYAPIKLS